MANESMIMKNRSAIFLLLFAAIATAYSQNLPNANSPFAHKQMQRSADHALTLKYLVGSWVFVRYEDLYGCGRKKWSTRLVISPTARNAAKLQVKETISYTIDFPGTPGCILNGPMPASLTRHEGIIFNDGGDFKMVMDDGECTGNCVMTFVQGYTDMINRVANEEGNLMNDVFLARKRASSEFRTFSRE
jgi:hypothetical protein